MSFDHSCVILLKKPQPVPRFFSDPLHRRRLGWLFYTVCYKFDWIQLLVPLHGGAIHLQSTLAHVTRPEQVGNPVTHLPDAHFRQQHPPVLPCASRTVMLKEVTVSVAANFNGKSQRETAHRLAPQVSNRNCGRESNTKP